MNRDSETAARLPGCAEPWCISPGTDAIQIALMGEGVGRGDALALPAFTCTATVEVPLLLGFGAGPPGVGRPDARPWNGRQVTWTALPCFATDQ